MDTTILSRELKTDTTMTKQITYRCLAGFKRTLDVDVGKELKTIDNFVAYDSGYPDNAFLPYCKDCEVAQIGLRLDDDGVGHIVKMCEINKVTKIKVE